MAISKTIVKLSGKIFPRIKLSQVLYSFLLKVTEVEETSVVIRSIEILLKAAFVYDWWLHRLERYRSASAIKMFAAKVGRRESSKSWRNVSANSIYHSAPTVFAADRKWNDERIWRESLLFSGWRASTLIITWLACLFSHSRTFLARIADKCGLVDRTISVYSIYKRFVHVHHIINFPDVCQMLSQMSNHVCLKDKTIKNKVVNRFKVQISVTNNLQLLINRNIFLLQSSNYAFGRQSLKISWNCKRCLHVPLQARVVLSIPFVQCRLKLSLEDRCL